MRRHHQGDHFVNAVGAHFFDCLLDARLPVTHAEIGLEAHRLTGKAAVHLHFQRLRLLAGQIEQRRTPADQGVALFDLFYQVR